MVLEGERIEEDTVTPEERGRIVDRTVNDECKVALVLIQTRNSQKHAEKSAFEDYAQST
jgi:hypothetical protein